MKICIRKSEIREEARVVVEGLTKEVSALLYGAWANPDICVKLDDRDAVEVPVWATLGAYMRYTGRKNRACAMKAWKRCVENLLCSQISFFTGRRAKYPRAGMGVFGFSQFFEESGDACFSLYTPAVRFLREAEHFPCLFLKEAGGVIDVELPPSDYDPYADLDGDGFVSLLQEILQ